LQLYGYLVIHWLIMEITISLILLLKQTTFLMGLISVEAQLADFPMAKLLSIFLENY
uniref:Uncharacterized protein n=1 Tax=Solanum lycopersicum TaxID=4081 RepID=A0A3Q7JM58_SOLLC